MQIDDQQIKPDGSSEPIRLVVIGAGGRGSTYARTAVRTGRAVVVAVADPHAQQRSRVAAEHGIEPALQFSAWQELVARGKIADAAIIATPDRLHVDPAIACAELGYDILLEKPMAPTEPEGERLVEAVERAKTLLVVCHVMRYTPYTQAIREVVRSGELGDVVCVDHVESIGWYHFAHSYVRGNWSREADSSSMLLSKCCHDVDWLSYVIGKRAVRVSSFGSLFQFRPERKPAGAGERCVDCAVEESCTYSALQIYRGMGAGFVDPVLRAVDSDDLVDALRRGPYGRCVYAGGNDASDHQIVMIEYEGGITASLTAVAFTGWKDRQTAIHGTEGVLEGDGTTYTVRNFRTNELTSHTPRTFAEGEAAGGHGGADRDLIDEFLAAVVDRSRAAGLSGPETTLETHRIAWAAERARHSGTVVEM